tara:strand:- start:47 stop:535 length:489 start_codon:yes stop_codon:yes gene_type:complete
MKSPMDMAPNKMKTPMKMAPNKMKSPMKGNAFTGAKAEAEASGADSFSVDGKEFPVKMKSPMEMKEPMKMKSPMKMGSAYKMDKSAFKMKAGPVNLKTPGSVAKMAGVSPAKHEQWTGEKHKEKAAHSNSAEAHGKQPKGTGSKPFTDGGDGAASRPKKIQG